MSSPTCYVDIRETGSSEQLSLDLVRHLPRRSITGGTLIITDTPTTMLPVVCKRWRRIIREVERQQSSTLQREKRTALAKELEHMHSLTIKATTSPHAGLADVLIACPGDIPLLSTRYNTLYITTGLSDEDFGIAIAGLRVGGVLVTYEEWTGEREEILLRKLKTNEYGKGVYPTSSDEG